MARMVDADKLIDFIDVGHLRHPGELCYSESDVANLLLHAPTVDAVEVVRCRDCKHWLKDVAGCTDFVGRCEFANYMVGATGYCTYGERKDSDGNG